MPKAPANGKKVQKSSAAKAPVKAAKKTTKSVGSSAPAKKSAAKSAAVKASKSAPAKKAASKVASVAKSAAKKVVAKKTAAKATAKAAPAKSVAKKSVAKSAPAKKVATKAPAAKPVAKKAAATTTPATTKEVSKSTSAKKEPAKKAAVKKAAASADKVSEVTPPKPTLPAGTVLKSQPSVPKTKTSTAVKAPIKPVVVAKPMSKAAIAKDPFLSSQQAMLLREREEYMAQADALREEAEQMAADIEPGDTQFDEESGEGATSSVDREHNLRLVTQAMQTVDEIDRALAKMLKGTYGLCEHCGNKIAQARLEALPFAALCVECKSGGLTRR